MSAVGGQNLRRGRGLQINPYPAELRTLVGNARSALLALSSGIDATGTLDSIQLDHLARAVDGLYPILDHIGARVGTAQTERLDAEHNAVAHVARALMAQDGPS